MKKLLASVLLAASLAVSGCSDSDDDFVFSPQNQGAVQVPGFFVDAATGNDATGNGATGAPFATVQAALAAAGVNGTVVVRPGNYAGAVNLLNGQQLIGAGFENVLPQGVVRPVFTGGPITMADGNIIRGVRVQNSAADAIIGDGRNGGTVSNCEIVNSGDEGVSAVGVTGTWSVVNNTVNTTGAAGIGVFVSTSGTAIARASATGNTITNCTLGAFGFVAGNTSQLNVQLVNNTMTGNIVGSTVDMNTGDGAVACFDITGNTNDDVYRFAAINTSTISVEQFSTLAAINNSGTIVVSGVSNPIMDVANGTCGF